MPQSVLKTVRNKVLGSLPGNVKAKKDFLSAVFDEMLSFVMNAGECSPDPGSWPGLKCVSLYICNVLAYAGFVPICQFMS